MAAQHQELLTTAQAAGYSKLAHDITADIRKYNQELIVIVSVLPTRDGLTISISYQNLAQYTDGQQKTFKEKIAKRCRGIANRAYPRLTCTIQHHSKTATDPALIRQFSENLQRASRRTDADWKNYYNPNDPQDSLTKLQTILPIIILDQELKQCFPRIITGPFPRLGMQFSEINQQLLHDTQIANQRLTEITDEVAAMNQIARLFSSADQSQNAIEINFLKEARSLKQAQTNKMGLWCYYQASITTLENAADDFLMLSSKIDALFKQATAAKKATIKAKICLAKFDEDQQVEVTGIAQFVLTIVSDTTNLEEIIEHIQEINARIKHNLAAFKQQIAQLHDFASHEGILSKPEPDKKLQPPEAVTSFLDAHQATLTTTSSSGAAPAAAAGTEDTSNWRAEVRASLAALAAREERKGKGKSDGDDAQSAAAATKTPDQYQVTIAGNIHIGDKIILNGSLGIAITTAAATAVTQHPQFAAFNTVIRRGKTIKRDGLGQNGIKIYSEDLAVVKINSGERLLCFSHKIAAPSELVFVPSKIVSHTDYEKLLKNTEGLKAIAQSHRTTTSIELMSVTKNIEMNPLGK